jgi:hypothetical protein
MANTFTKTCGRGHALSGDNLYVALKNSDRACRICRKRHHAKFMQLHPNYRYEWHRAGEKPDDQAVSVRLNTEAQGVQSHALNYLSAATANT